MGLEKELLAVLNNPSHVWTTVLNTMEQHSRTLILTFTTCQPGTDLIAWQEATARIDVDTASRFEAALRPLDDTFVSINRTRTGRRSASFRNPSMEDFCVSYLDRNVGFAIGVVSQDPSLPQIVRLIQLSRARRADEFANPGLHQAFIGSPRLLLKPLAKLLRQRKHDEERTDDVVGAILELTSWADRAKRLDRNTAARVRDLVGESVLGLNFAQGSFRIWSVLGMNGRAHGARVMLGDDFAQCYHNLWKSASGLHDFDRLIDLDEELGLEPYDAEWREHFESLSDEWYPDDSGSLDLDEAKEARDRYVRIVDYLGGIEDDFSDEWEGLVDRLEADLYDPSDEAREQWYHERSNPIPDPGSAGGGPTGLDEAGDPLSAMFESLLAEKDD